MTYLRPLLMLTVLAVALAACDSDDDPVDVIDGPTVVELAQDSDDLEALVAALTDAGLVATLEGDGPFTVFAPTDDAFDAFGALPEGDALRDVLLYHVLGQEAPSSALSDGLTLNTQAGPSFTIVASATAASGFGIDTDRDGTADADIETVDLDASNGIVHLIDAVLVPPEVAATTFTVEIENVVNGGEPYPVVRSGAFTTPVGASEPGPIGPGGAYEVTFTAAPGQRLSFATMFIQSNDLFYAFPGAGLPLFDDDGTAVSGDVTSEVFLYDAGTEVNEEPGTGENQAPRQEGEDDGDDEDGVVTVIADGATDAGGFTYPNVADVINVTLTPTVEDGATSFTFRIENVSEPGDVADDPDSGEPQAVPLSPGAFAVHTDAIAFYTLGEAAPAGIEDIAEDGVAATYAEALAPLTGRTVPFSPGAYAVHTPIVSLFALGEAASDGLEDIAEDGDPAVLAAALPDLVGVASAGVFNTPDGATEPGPIGPGASYTFEVTAEPGQLLSFATMYIQSNDLFLAPGAGLALFDEDGTPVSGDVTEAVALYDAGTEVDEEPGVGLNQAPRQAGPDTGDDEDGTVTLVEGESDGFSFEAVSDLVRVTVTPSE